MTSRFADACAAFGLSGCDVLEPLRTLSSWAVNLNGKADTGIEGLLMVTFHGTTVVSVRKDGQLAIGSDGQVTIGNTIMKHHAVKVRRLADGRVLAGFAGAVSDAFTLFERFEGKLNEFNKNLVRAAVELGKEWRTDKYLRNLEALLAVCDAEASLVVAGSGEVIQPDDGIIAIGSGGSYALAAARVLVKHSTLDAEGIVREALATAAEICIYTNNHITVETL
jgi:ATP-dependent HslUV protease subunit HslV